MNWCFSRTTLQVNQMFISTPSPCLILYKSFAFADIGGTTWASRVWKWNLVLRTRIGPSYCICQLVADHLVDTARFIGGYCLMSAQDSNWTFLLYLSTRIRPPGWHDSREYCVRDSDKGIHRANLSDFDISFYIFLFYDREADLNSFTKNIPVLLWQLDSHIINFAPWVHGSSINWSGFPLLSWNFVSSGLEPLDPGLNNKQLRGRSTIPSSLYWHEEMRTTYMVSVHPSNSLIWSSHLAIKNKIWIELYRYSHE